MLSTLKLQWLFQKILGGTKQIMVKLMNFNMEKEKVVIFQKTNVQTQINIQNFVKSKMIGDVFSMVLKKLIVHHHQLVMVVNIGPLTSLVLKKKMKNVLQFKHSLGIITRDLVSFQMLIVKNQERKQNLNFKELKQFVKMMVKLLILKMKIIVILIFSVQLKSKIIVQNSLKEWHKLQLQNYNKKVLSKWFHKKVIKI